ncbi:MAG: cellulase family glycosylhydrolase [Bacteroidales bacterium]|nr:cellulase family glycosylhydrolase [Bacteroidales bacterium]
MKKQSIKGLLICINLIFIYYSGFAQTSTIIFRDDFEDSARSVGLWGPPANYSFTTGYTGKGLFVNNPSASNDIMLYTNIPTDSLKGSTIALSAMIRGENLSQPAQTWLGMKVMLVITLKDNSITYPQIPADTGTFAWKEKGTLIFIDSNVTDIKLYIGIQQGSGKLWFDDVTIVKFNTKKMPPARDPGIPINKCHSLLMSRGVNVSPLIDKNSLDELANDWKANHIRWQIGGCTYPSGLLRNDYDSILTAEFLLLDSAVKWCTANGLQMIVDMHSLSEGLFISSAAQTRLVDTWKIIATKYKNANTVWAYDLANEPDNNKITWPIGSDVLFWNELADTIAKAIRSIDADKPVIVESYWAMPENFNNLVPIDFSIPNIIYSPHFYEPHLFTHQTLYGNITHYSYPGVIGGKYYDKDTLKKLLQPVKNFQDKYRVPIYVGEFSAIRWAPNNSAYNYIRDCIEIFEEYNWDWSYHAFREYQGWDVEYTTDSSNINKSPVQTDRELLLRLYFQQHILQIPGKDNEKNTNNFYPNPASDKIIIETGQNINRSILFIYAINGRELIRQQITETRTEIDISNLPQGIYIVKFINNKRVEVGKLIKNE